MLSFKQADTARPRNRGKANVKVVKVCGLAI